MPVTGIAEGVIASQELANQNALRRAQEQQIQLQIQARQEQMAAGRQQAIDRENFRNALSQYARGGGGQDLNALARVMAEYQPEHAAPLLKLAAEQDAARQWQEQQRNMLGGGPVPMPQGMSQPPAPNLSFLSPQDAATVRADMARNPAAQAQFSNDPRLTKAPPQWGQGMPLNQPVAPMPQGMQVPSGGTQAPQGGGMLGPYLGHQNPDIRNMALQVQAGMQAGIYKDRADLNAAVERLGAAAVQAGNIDRGMAGGALTPAVNATGQPVFVQAGRGGTGVQQVPGFAPPPNQGREPPISYQMMTPEQIRMAGLPEGTVAQMDSRGQVHPLPASVGTGKALPVGAVRGLLDNQQNLRRAEQAFALIQGLEAGGAKGSATAIGVKGYLPEAFLQRMDPAGVDTRAAIADLGSLIIHDRSGAAVTVGEYPRLRPFIPLVTDDAAAAKKKLSRFVTEYRNIAQEMKDFYKESGYRVPDVLQGSDIQVPQVPTGGAQAPSTGWKVIR